jgi:ABC-type nickel/cobalt efflux system permease component RcnA
VIPRRLLLSLIASLAVLLVAFAVVIAGYALVSAAQDTAAAQALWWVGMSLLMLVLVDLVLLVGVLALRELDRDDE